MSRILKNQMVELSTQNIAKVSPLVGLPMKTKRVRWFKLLCCIEWKELLSYVLGVCVMIFFVTLFLGAWFIPASELEGNKGKEVTSYGDSLSARP